MRPRSSVPTRHEERGSRVSHADGAARPDRAAGGAGGTGPGGAAAGPPRIDLRVLVLTDGSAWVEGIRQQLDAEGVPSTVVNLADPARPVITSAFLADQLADGTPHAKFDGVVVPGSGVSADEQAALAAFEAQFGIRQVDAFSFPSAAVGLNAPAFAGSLDGVTATVTPAGLGGAADGAFRYLTGPVAFEDNDPAVAESFGYLATPLPDDPATGSHFEPIVTAAAPGTSTQHVIAGVHRSGGREQLVLTFAFNYHQQQFRLLAHGVVDWLTHGIHLGYWRNYLTVHVDDLFSADARWSATGKCTPGEGDCPPGTPDTAPIRMTPADVDRAVAWQQQQRLHPRHALQRRRQRPADRRHRQRPADGRHARRQGPVPVDRTTPTPTSSWAASRTSRVIPWRCATDPATGHTVYASQAFLDSEIAKNIAWAATQRRHHPRRRARRRRALGHEDPAPAAGRQPELRRGADRAEHQVAGHGRVPRARAARRRLGPRRAAPPDQLLLQRRQPRRGGLRVQLDLHLGGRRRQRDLHREPGDDHLHRAARPGHRVHRPHRARAGPDHARLRPDQRPAAVLRPPVEPGRERPALPRARPRCSAPTGRSSRGARRWSS